MTSWHLEELMAEQEHEPHNYCQNPTCADGANYATDTVKCEECGKKVCKSCAYESVRGYSVCRTAKCMLAERQAQLMDLGDVLRESIRVDGFPWLSGPSLPASWIQQAADRRRNEPGVRVEMWVECENGARMESLA